MAKPDSDVIIIGAGITGIGAAYYLRANNVSYTILEGKDDLVEFWNTHRWHGARCDSDFIKYSFSFDRDLQGGGEAGGRAGSFRPRLCGPSNAAPGRDPGGGGRAALEILIVPRPP